MNFNDLPPRTHLPNEVGSKYRMRPTRVFIEFMWALLPILESLMKDCLYVRYRCTLHYHQILHEESILEVPSTMEDTRGGVE